MRYFGIRVDRECIVCVRGGYMSPIHESVDVVMDVYLVWGSREWRLWTRRI